MLLNYSLLFGRKENMDSIISMYKTVNKQGPSSSSDFNYTPHKFYLDPLQIKKEKEKQATKYMKDKSNKKLNLNIKKGTFLEQIEKRQVSLPSPQSYSPKQYSPNYKDRQHTNLPQRKTIFQQIKTLSKKFKSPGPFDYSTVKTKSRSACSFDKSGQQNFLDSEISKACRLPGVGQYNAFRQKYDKTLGKLDVTKRSINKQQKQNFPSSCAYSPHKIDKKLFSEIEKIPKKSSTFQKKRRFMLDKQNITNKLFYAGLSEWGMKTNYKKKDILANLSTHNCYSKSVYYN